jgi:hypothetical protein
MIIIISLRRPDGTYPDNLDDPGRKTVTRYLTIQGAVRFAALPFARGTPFRVQIPYKRITAYFDGAGNEIKNPVMA